jgi:SAM-dependent methyltransferase
MDIDVDRTEVFGESRPGMMERIAPGYFEADVEAEHLARYHWAAALLGRRRVTGMVLDLASGTGYGTVALGRVRGCRVVGVERSFAAARFGRRQYPSVVAVGDVTALPLRLGCARAVVSFETIEHLAEPSSFLGQAVEALGPEGTLVLSTPNVCHSWGDNPHHLHEMDRAELAGALVDAGFDRVEWFGQRWELPDGRWRRLPGLRKVAASLDWRLLRHLLRPRRSILGGVTPRFWCVVARRR